jgi:hypothetical protein
MRNSPGPGWKYVAVFTTRHVIKLILNLRFLSNVPPLPPCDVACVIYLAWRVGQYGAEVADEGGRTGLK